MSVIIRLQNLPWSANSMDIRNYFQGLSIPEGGVHIVGGEQGDAFIAFSTDEDARQAMANDGGKIKEVKIKLLLSSRSEMQKVIEQARQTSMNFQNMIQTPPVNPNPIAQTPANMMGMPNPVVGQMPQQTPQTTPAAQITAPGQQPAATPAATSQNLSQQALAQKDWQGMGGMGMPAQPMGMPGMMPMPPNALSMMGLMPGLPAHFAQMAQMGMLGPNPMAMATNFFAAQQNAPRMPGAPAAPGATDNALQQTPNVHPVFSQGPNNQFGGPNPQANQMTGPNVGPMGGPNGPPNQMSGTNAAFNPMLGPNGQAMQMPGGANMPFNQMMGPNGPNPMPGSNVPFNPMAGPNGPFNQLAGPNGPMLGPNGPNNMAGAPLMQGGPGGPNAGGPGGPNASGQGGPNAGVNNGPKQPPAPPTITPADRNKRDNRKASDEDEVKILEDNSRSSRSRSRERRRLERERDRKDRDKKKRSRSRSRERRRRERSRERREKDRKSRKSRSRSRDRSRHSKDDKRSDSTKPKGQQEESNNASFNQGGFNSNMQGSQGARAPVHVPFSNIDTSLNLDTPSWKPVGGTQSKGPEPNTCMELRNVPLNVRYVDIKNFFQYYPLSYDGIKIINDNNGKRTGIVYVQFYKAEVRNKALQALNGARLLDSQVELYSIDDEIFTKAVNGYRPPRNGAAPPTQESAAPLLIFKVLGLPSNVQRKDIASIFEGIDLETIRVNREDSNKVLAYVKITKESDAKSFTSVRKTHSVGGKAVLVVPCFEAEFSEAVKKFPDEPEPLKTDCVLIKNLPRQATDRDVCDFFSDIGLVPLKIHLMFTAQGEPSGDVFCEFQSPEEANRAVSKNESLFGRNTVSVLLVTRQTLNEALGAPLSSPSGQGNAKSLLGPPPGFMGQGPQFNDPRMGRGLLDDPRQMDNGPMGPNGMNPMDMGGPPMNRMGQDGPPMDRFGGQDGPPMDRFGGQDGPPMDRFGGMVGPDGPPRFDNRFSPRGSMRGRGRGRGGYSDRGDGFDGYGREGPDFRGGPGGPDFRGGPDGSDFYRGGPDFNNRGRPDFSERGGPGPMRGGAEYNRGRPDFGNRGRGDRGDDRRGPKYETSDVTSPENFGKPGCVLALENIPYRANMDDIIMFFQDFELTRDNIIRRYDDDGRPTGDARVCLASPAEAQRALHLLNQKPIHSRPVYITPV